MWETEERLESADEQKMVGFGTKTGQKTQQLNYIKQ
jgi:hypothetical protein